MLPGASYLTPCEFAGPWLQQHKAKAGEKLGILQALEGRLPVALEQENGSLIGLTLMGQVPQDCVHLSS